MSLFIVGIGPGGAEHLTPAAAQALSNCEHILGYDYYLSLIERFLAGKQCHRYQLGQETERVRHSLKLASSGQSTCLVSSGDAGIYGMASLAFELLHKEYSEENQKDLEIEVIPGISAMQSAAARIGAPLGHDFAVISLSDLLTPWSIIKQRLEAAAQADFVLVLYNPGSKTRIEQIEKARDICLKHRKSQTPVIIGRNISRTDESITHLSLLNLDRSKIDMMSLVIIGNSQTVSTGNWVYTPRGYSRTL